MRRTFILICSVLPILAVLFFLRSYHLQADAGDPDPGFGTQGVAFTDFGGSNDEANALAIQPDGKIVAAGTLRKESGNDFALARYNEDGSLDPEFGDAGKVITDFGGGEDCFGVAVTADGKIVAVGRTFNRQDSKFDFAIIRYKQNGKPDTGFGNGGRIVADFFGSSSQARAVAIQTDGKILVAGWCIRDDQDFIIARYDAEGKLDPSFGTGGVTATDFGSDDVLSGIALQPDGRIVAAGTTINVNVGARMICLARYDSNGSLDPGFDVNGKVSTETAASGEEAHAVVIQPDGKILVAGDATPFSQSADSSNTDFALRRYTPGGTPDLDFGVNGKVTTDFMSVLDQARGLRLQSDGKILVAGWTFSRATSTDTLFDFNYAFVRYDSQGNKDAEFGNGGTVIKDFFGDFDRAQDLVVHPNGKIIIAGTGLRPGSGSDFALASYDTGTGPIITFDTCLRDNNNGNTLKLNSQTGDYIFAGCGPEGSVFSGKGNVSQAGCTIELKDKSNGRKLTGSLDTCLKTGALTIKVTSPKKKLKIRDSNTTDSICDCGES